MSHHEERPTLADEAEVIRCPACDCRAWEPLLIDPRRMGSEMPMVCDDCVGTPGEACSCCGKLVDKLVIEDRFNCPDAYVCEACYAEAVREEAAEVAA